MELQDKITEIMSDPQAMENLKSMANELFGSGESGGASAAAPPAAPDGGGLLDGIDPAALLSVVGSLKHSGDDDRTRLLCALKPYLSERRRARVDGAIKILKLLSILPVLKEQGILNNLLGI